MTTDNPYPQSVSISAKWVGYYALLWLVLAMLSQLDSIRDVVIAFAWLIAAATLFLLLDPQNPANLFQRLGFISEAH